jgi:serine/threonine protein kinase
VRYAQGAAPAVAGGRVVAGGAQLQAPRVVQSGGYGGSSGSQPQAKRVVQPQGAVAPQYAPAAQQYTPMPQQAAAMGARPKGGNAAPKIAALLETPESRKQLKNGVIQSFKKVASGTNTDINGLRCIRAELAQALGIPESVFGSLEDEYVRFDFDGSGFLSANEVYKLVKWHLYEYLQQAGMVKSSSIPTKSIAQAGYTITRDLGEGNQATVREAVDQYGNMRCIKCFHKSGMNMGSLAELQDEFQTMQLLACLNIARSFEIFQDPGGVYMVGEVYHGGDLTGLKQKGLQAMGSLSEDWWRGVFGQCFQALSFMHQQAMMHCDIKEPNMMLRNENYREPQVVLIDFGVSKAMTAKDTGMVSGTPGYMPPETMNTGKWYPGGDVFSMGVVIYQIMTDRTPNEALEKKGHPMCGLFLRGCTSLDDVKYAVNSRQPDYNAMPATMPGVRRLAERLLDKNLRTRVKAPTALKDPWFGTLFASKNNAVEDVLRPTNQLATVGITDEMMSGVPLR